MRPRTIGRPVASTILLVATLLARTSSADDLDAPARPNESRFDDKHRLILGVERLLPIVQHTATETRISSGGPSTEEERTSSAGGIGAPREPDSAHEVPRLSLDYVVVPHLTIGGAPILSVSESRWVAGVAPRLGFPVSFNANLALWPRLGVTYLHASADRLSVDMAALSVDVSLVITVVEHAAVTLGMAGGVPLGTNFDGYRTSDLTATHVGLYGGLLGWL